MQATLAYQGLNLGSSLTTKVFSVMKGISSIRLYSNDYPCSLCSSMNSFSISTNSLLISGAHMTSSLVNKRQIFKYFNNSIVSGSGESSSHTSNSKS